jgi:hypothetical protein
MKSMISSSQTVTQAVILGLVIPKTRSSASPLAVREMIKGNDRQVYVSDLSSFRVTNLMETFALVHVGNRNLDDRHQCMVIRYSNTVQ